MFDLDDCVGFITNTASKQISDAFNEKLNTYSITRVQWIALYFLGKHNYVSQSELAVKMNIKNSTMVRLIDRMEKEGLVNRIKCKDDRRITNIYLTDLGISRINELLWIGEEFGNLVAKDISEKDIETFKNVLKKMVQNVI